MNIDHLQTLFKECENQILVHDLRENRTFTYGQIYKFSKQFAALLLKEKNLQKGDFVGIVLDNRIETFLTYFACIFAGFVAVPINPQLSIADIAQILDLASPKIVMSSKAIAETVLQNTKHPLFLFDTDINLEDIKNYTESTCIKKTDLIEVMFTSGTTGLPKAVPIVLDKILGNGDAFKTFHDVPTQSVFYNILPSCYLGGWYNLFLIPLLSKGTIVLDDPFGPSNMFRFWETVKTYNISVLWFSPTILSMLLAIGLDEMMPKENITRQITHAFVGMAPLSANLKKEFESVFGIELHENFALSETFFLTSEKKNNPRKEGSSGKILPNIDIHIDIIDEKQGEVLIKSPYMIEGYYTPQGIDSSMYKNGYFPTGDLGYIDEDGYLFITGRLKDIIIRGGINISPADIENTMRSLTSIQEVAVFGIPDAVYGEQVGIAIQLKKNVSLSEDDVRDFCEKNLAAIKQPKEIFFIEDIPKNASGKIQKKDLKTKLLNIF